jgi:hypothetical protein
MVHQRLEIEKNKENNQSRNRHNKEYKNSEKVEIFELEVEEHKSEENNIEGIFSNHFKLFRSQKIFGKKKKCLS